MARWEQSSCHQFPCDTSHSRRFGRGRRHVCLLDKALFKESLQPSSDSGQLFSAFPNLQSVCGAMREGVKREDDEIAVTGLCPA